MSRPILITNCTKRKRNVAAPGLQLRAKRGETLRDASRRWVTSLATAPKVGAAIDYYCGTGMSAIRATAEAVDAEVRVVSAGLGLIKSSDLVPHYNLTIAGGAHTVRSLLGDGETIADWWTALTASPRKGRPLSRLVQSNPDAPVLLALPSLYLELIADDLSTLSPKEAVNVRIFTSDLGLAALPEHLHRLCMPYDNRLESSGIPGTRADFPQRALKHFVCELAVLKSPVDRARRSVEAALAELQAPETPRRERISDEQVSALLRDGWDRHQGQSSRLLRFLRDEQGVACEQRRFRDLWRKLSAEYAA